MADLTKLRWYFSRLSSMSPAEIGYRVRQRITVLQDRLTGLPDQPRLPADSWQLFRQEDGANFYFRAADQTTIQQRHLSDFRREFDATMRTAESLLNHTFQLFGQTFRLGTQISWNTDPLTQKQWPDSFYASLDTRDGQTFGGVKWVWELNRHHHFVTLGKAYFLSGEERFAAELARQWTDWIEKNPPLSGVNWTSSLELALRMINWAWALALVRRSSALNETVFAQIMGSVSEQCSYIARHLSKHSSANNHFIGEAAGLATVGLCYPWLPLAGRWRDEGLDILKREMALQITPDGVTVEQALSYLSFVLDFNLLVWQLARINGKEAPALWYERLAAACDFLICLMDTSGRVPAIGDSDDAYVVRLDDRQEAGNYASILATAAALLERSDFKYAARRWDEKSQWLLGESGLTRFNSLSSAGSVAASRVFEKGGYGVLHTARARIVFDCGPLGYLSTAAHGHADALNVLASIDGFPLFVDPGTYAYQEGGAWRDYFRATRAHNTIVVDGCDQSEMKGAFLWGHKAQATLLKYQLSEDEDLMVAEHDGYATLGVIHRRAVLLRRPNWLLIGDLLLGDGKHKIEQFWHLHPAWNVEIVDNRVVMTREGQQLAMELIDLPQANITSCQGQMDPIRGWYSSHYGHKESAPAIRTAVEVDLPTSFVVILTMDGKPDFAGRSEVVTDLMRTLESAGNMR